MTVFAEGAKVWAYLPGGSEIVYRIYVGLVFCPSSTIDYSGWWHLVKLMDCEGINMTAVESATWREVNEDLAAIVLAS